jgi:hypothetical protein
MAFKKKKLFIIFIMSCIIANILYDKYVKIGFDVIEVNLEDFCVDSNQSYYLFRFERRIVSIEDLNNKIVKMFNDKTVFKNHHFILRCKQNKRYILLIEGAILKTKNDSIDVMKYEDKLHGYMGVFLRNDCYYVDENGKIDTCDQNIETQNIYKDISKKF